MARKIHWSVDVSGLPLEHLQPALDEAKTAGAQEVFVEIGDGQFGRSFGAGTDILAAIQRCCDLAIHLHAQVADPDAIVDQLLALGCQAITLPVETLRHGHRAMSQIQEYGVRAGVSVLPATSLATIHYLELLLDHVLLLPTEVVAPKKALPSTAFDRIRIAQKHLAHRRLKTRIYSRASLDAPTFSSQSESGVNQFVVRDPAWVTGGAIADTISRISPPQ